MNSRIANFELDGNTVLGFDTGLSAQAFAQAKMAQFITSMGTIVYPDGNTEAWRPGGVVEQGAKPAETMVIWGPSFPGERLDTIIKSPERKEEAMDALCSWIRAALVLEKEAANGKEPPFPGPAGAFIAAGGQRDFPPGTILFPPLRLLKRSLEADNAAPEAECWVHPDLKGNEALSFSAGAMLYGIFCGAPPFPGKNANEVSHSAPPAKRVKASEGSPLDELRQDIREGVFMPPDLAAPGLSREMAELIANSMSRISRNKEENVRPSAESIRDFIGASPRKPVSSWITAPGGEELIRIGLEREQYRKKNALTVKTRRFVIRNTAIIAVSAVALIVAIFMIRGFIRHRAELPTTRGMNPLEVAETFYNSFGLLDHTMMDACVSGKAGKGDVDMVMNLFVISRVRQAYEAYDSHFISAGDWIEQGSPETDATVFGITDLKIKVLSVDENSGNAALEAEYILWMPGSYLRDSEEPPSAGEIRESAENIPIPPGGMINTDRLKLAILKGLWRITEIERQSRVLKP